MLGYSFQFSYLQPSRVMLAFQDYEGAWADNADAAASEVSWTKLDISGLG